MLTYLLLTYLLGANMFRPVLTPDGDGDGWRRLPVSSVAVYGRLKVIPLHRRILLFDPTAGRPPAGGFVQTPQCRSAHSNSRIVGRSETIRLREYDRLRRRISLSAAGDIRCGEFLAMTSH